MKYSEIYDRIMELLENCDTELDKKIILNACLNYFDNKEQAKESMK